MRQSPTGDQLTIPVGGQKGVQIPIQTHATYLGCIMSYANFEDATTWQRVKLAHVGFLRLRRWLCNKHQFSLTNRLRLWRTCILPIMTYGVFAVGVTHKGLKHMLIQTTKMLRQIVQDHPHHTGHSHEFVFQHFSLPSPVDVLIAAVRSLQQSVAQRQLNQCADDLATSMDWRHLALIPDMITETQATLTSRRVETALSGEVHAEDSLYHCRLCNFNTNHVPAFRRHCAVVHGIRMFRTLHLSPQQFMIDGLPTCKHCHTVFSTWRSFHAHVQRGCQAILLGPPACTGTPAPMVLPAPMHASPRGTTLLTAQDLTLLQSQPWGSRILQLIADDALDLLEHEQAACQYLSRYCCLCGQHLHRTQDVHLHFRTDHAAFWDNVAQKAMVLTNLHSSDSPCPHCGGYFRQHKCPVWTQISVLVLHGAGLLASDQMLLDIVHRCDVCLEVLPDALHLTQHLKDKHGLAGISYNVARDSLSGQAACAHCGATMSSMESLRSHIVQGRCSSFNPLATAETSEVDPSWADICIHGHAFAKLRAPMDRLRLTLRCLHCPQTYKRAGDLANHLMTNHSRLWRQSQRLTLLLVDLIFARHGCTCNPQINQIRQNHVCLPLRQIAMAFYRLDPAPFMPVPITDNVLSHLLHTTLPRETRFELIKLFADRRFSDLWVLPEVRCQLSSACLMCGHAQEPGLLCRHFHEAHMCNHQYTEFYMESLLPLIRQALTTDYRCDLCGQIFNLPPDTQDSEPDAARSKLVQTHLQGNCPVSLQASLLLATALNGGRLGHEWLGLEHTGTDQGDLSISGANLRSFTESSTQPEGTEGAQDQHAGRARRSRSARHRPKAAPTVPAGTGTTGLAARSQLEHAAKHRFIHTFFQQDKEGSLPGLLQETQKWQMNRQQNPSMQHPTLRQHLSQWFMQDMLHRVTKVSTSKPGEALFQACLEKNLIQEDQSWNYLRWDATQKKLLVDKKKAVSMAKMLQHMQELIEDFKEPTLVVRFQGLATSSQQPIIPWKLQLNMRMDRAYDSLHTLTHNAVWLLAGTSLKTHTTQPSQLTRHIQGMLPQTKGKGKSKTKGKGKPPSNA